VMVSIPAHVRFGEDADPRHLLVNPWCNLDVIEQHSSQRARGCNGFSNYRFWQVCPRARGSHRTLQNYTFRKLGLLRWSPVGKCWYFARWNMANGGKISSWYELLVRTPNAKKC